MSRMLVAAGLCGALAALPAAARAADIVAASNGGIWEQATRTCFVKPFEARTGKTVGIVLGTPAQWTNQILANPQSPPVDVIVSSVDNVIENVRRGIIDPMTPAQVPALNDMDPRQAALGGGYGVTMAYSSLGIAYNKDSVKKPPQSWTEFVDRTVAGEWKAAIPSMRQSSTPSAVVWMLANAYGGGVDNIEPGFAAIKRMKESGNLRIWNDMNEFLSLIKTGEIDIGMYWEGRTWAFHDDGNPEILFTRPKPGVVANNAILQKVKNGKPLAWDFINEVVSPEAQSCFSQMMNYGVANLKAVVPARIVARLTKPEEIAWPPYRDIAPKVRDWVERWNKEIDR